MHWLVTFFGSFTTLFAIVDPFAMMPIFLTLTERFPHAERLRVCRKATLIALGILLCFAVGGEAIFRLFGISIPAFRIAGGILLLLLGIAQLSAAQVRVKQEEENESLERDDISIFPIATPLLAGPGAISAVVLQAGQSTGAIDTALLLLAIVCVFVVSYLLLRAAPYFYHLLGKTGLNLITRLMGIILTAIAVQYIIDGVSSVWRQLQQGL